MGVIQGRMYDYNNARFLSVDPFIQAPTSTQSLNPYTYIFNNPLSGTDPTGYINVCDTFISCTHEEKMDPKINKPLSFSGSRSNGISEQSSKTTTNTSEVSISEKGNQEGVFNGVVVPAAKNLGSDLVDKIGLILNNTAVPASQIVNKFIAIPLLQAAGAAGEIVDDHQGELNTLQSFGPVGLEAEFGIILAGKGLTQLSKFERLLNSTVKGGGATLEKLSTSEIKRIQNAANRSGKDITIVGSRVNPNKALHDGSDFDFIVDANHKTRNNLSKSLPGSKSAKDGVPLNQDIFNEAIDKSLPHVIFKPEKKL